MFRRLRNQRGFTLVELLIAMVLGLIVLGGVLSAFSMQDKAYRVQEQITDMQQKVRAAADLMVKDVRMAGYGLPATGVGSWVTWVAMTANPEITDGGGTNPDQIAIAAAFDTAVGSLAADALTGAPSLTLGPGEGANFNTTDQSVLYLGRNESGVVQGVVGDVLAVDMDPVTPGIQGVGTDYPAGTPVEVVRVITYHLVGTTLMRNENTGGGDQPVVDGIEDLQVSRSGDTVTIALTARTAKPDPDYTDPGTGDGYRRMTYAPQVNLRNL